MTNHEFEELSRDTAREQRMLLRFIAAMVITLGVLYCTGSHSGGSFIAGTLLNMAILIAISKDAEFAYWNYIHPWLGIFPIPLFF